MDSGLSHHDQQAMQEEEQQFLESEAMPTAKVYQAIAAVTHQMGHEGISKARKNQQQGYNFRGIDDVYNALSSMLAANKLCILPNVLERELIERQSAKGGALFYVTVKVRFDFVSAEDGSKHEVVTYGEAMDSGDKATNKAMSAAYKYAAMQTFCIPTEGDNDADAHTHTVAAMEREDRARTEQEKSLVIEAGKASKKGVEEYKKFWTGLAAEEKQLIGPHRHVDFKLAAEEIATQP